jgi:hypothetical protein
MLKTCDEINPETITLQQKKSNDARQPGIAHLNID